MTLYPTLSYGEYTIDFAEYTSIENRDMGPHQITSSPYTYFAAGVATALLTHSIVSSLQTIPKSKANEPASPQASTHTLPYPPHDFIPGERSVPTPYGTIRIYEFGPADCNHKVLFLHGISTPCVSLLSLAEDLAYKKGYRVMLMDLFGRGWSGGPADLPYDNRLYFSQIFMALASSPLAWTGEGSAGFGLVGYSLGGGLAADFVSWFPELVTELVMIAPCGVMRRKLDWKGRILYSQGWLPDRWLQWGVRWRLKINPNIRAKQEAWSLSEDDERLRGESAVSAELPKGGTALTSRGEIDMEAVVQWQMSTHEGAISAFMSSMRHCPIWDQHERWRMIGARLDQQSEILLQRDDDRNTELKERALRRGLKSGKVIVIVGKKDTIIKPEEVIPDAQNAFGNANVDARICDAGHELPITCCHEIADIVHSIVSK